MWVSSSLFLRLGFSWHSLLAATRPLGDTGTPSPLAENNVKDVDETATLPIYGIMGYNPYV